MGSIEEQVEGHEGNRSEVTVLVTGFGPFHDKFPVNPSFEITQNLPQFLPSKSPGSPSIRIMTYPSPIRVAYEEVRELVPKIHNAYKGTVDLVLHIGMASGRQFYCAEKYGHREGYNRNNDVDGKMPPSDEPSALFGDCPPLMTTSLDYQSVLLNWQVNIFNIPKDEPGAEADVRPSDDAGRYLCDYIYFNSLAYFGRESGVMVKGKASDRPVLFFHVPPESDRKSLEKGQAVTLALLQAMANTFWKQQRSSSG